jgi:endoglucanase
VWHQIATRYHSRSDFIIYELLNEPHEISDGHWGEIQSRTIEVIQKIDDRHWIIVGGSQWNSIGGLQKLPIYSHPKLFYTFHFYDPMLFTHQGASWVRPSLQPISNIPFPVDSGPLPACPPSFANTWIEHAFKRYREAANFGNLERPFDSVVQFANQRKVPVFCGEYGVLKTNCKKDDRTRWYQVITEFMDRRRIPRISWDYQNGFGVFENEKRTQFNIDLLHAMKFTPQPIDWRPITFDRFAIHADFFPKGVKAGTWDQEAVLNFFDTEVPVSRFGIRWGNASRYGAFWIIFPEPFDFTKQVQEHSVLQFIARTRDVINFEVRFVNTLPIPWRMRFVIDSKLLPPDGDWHLIRIPLQMMQDIGAWVPNEQKWVGSQGKFSWSNVEKLEFVPENEDLKGKYIQFDSIVFSKITSC